MTRITNIRMAACDDTLVPVVLLHRTALYDKCGAVDAVGTDECDIAGINESDAANQCVHVPDKSTRTRLRSEQHNLETTMTIVTSRLASVVDALAFLDRYPEADPFKDGDILRFDRRYSGDDGVPWPYVAARIIGTWFISGMERGITWDELVEFMGFDVDDVVHVNAVNDDGVYCERSILV